MADSFSPTDVGLGATAQPDRAGFMSPHPIPHHRQIYTKLIGSLNLAAMRAGGLASTQAYAGSYLARSNLGCGTVAHIHGQKQIDVPKLPNILEMYWMPAFAGMTIWSIS